MKKRLFMCAAACLLAAQGFAQDQWAQCSAPVFNSRIDDVFMVNEHTGYAVCGDGQVVKTVNGGNSWQQLLRDSTVYCRFVEFMNEQKGFVGGFPIVIAKGKAHANVLRRTTDGGLTWTDLSSRLDIRAQQGICGLAIAGNTIYGSGNWYQDSGYIVKSSDGGETWSYIDMHPYATSIIDMYFVNKDTGFVLGKGIAPANHAVIYYTTNGGLSWSKKFEDTVAFGYCWKLQHLSDQVYYSAIEEYNPMVMPRILKSADGGMSWSIQPVSGNGNYRMQGVGFIDEQHGWAGGSLGYSFETHNGGITWDSVPTCSMMNRVFRVNDHLVFATGDHIWKYGEATTGINDAMVPANKGEQLHCTPNPADDVLSVSYSFPAPTRALLMLFDSRGNKISVLENADQPAGSYTLTYPCAQLAPGAYYLVLKTHAGDAVEKVVIRH